MTTLRQQVREFHEANGVPIGERPALLSPDRLRLRLELKVEEFLETLDAAGADGDSLAGARTFLSEAIDFLDWRRFDMVGFADGIADENYVNDGALIELGIDGAPIAAEVHRSNMSKLGADGKPVLRADGKIIKGPNYSPPDIDGCLRAQGWEP